MKIEFLGTAGPMTVPRPLCKCQLCKQAREKVVPYSRSGPSLFIHGPNILIDTSEDIHFQLNRSRITEINGIFYSHWHPDHVMGRRILESLNANYVHHAPMGTQSDVFLPEQVAADFNRFLGTGDHLNYFKSRGFIKIHEIKEGSHVNVNQAEISPLRLAEDFAYGFLVRGEDKKILIVPDELANWEPTSDLAGLDLAVLPIGIFEYHPMTGERMIALEHPLLQTECTFLETIEIVKKLNPKKTVLTHINGLSFDDLKQVERQLQAEGLNIEIAYDTLIVEVL